MTWYEKADYYYNVLHSWTKPMIRKLVEKGKITKEEYKQIVDEVY